MSAMTPSSRCTHWRSERLFRIDFMRYTLVRHHFPRHFHDHFVIELVTEGTDAFYCQGQTYTAGKQQLVLINPGEVHTGSTPEGAPLSYYSLCPDHAALEEAAAALEITLPRDFVFPFTLLSSPVVSEKFRLFFSSLVKGDSIMLQEELFFDGMTALLREIIPARVEIYNTGHTDSRVRFLTGFIRSHFTEDISLRQMGLLVGLNPFTLSRLFRKTLGVSPYEYLLITRTEEAKKLLRKGRKVQEAALETGFYDSSHLHRLFLKFDGISPKNFLSSKGQDRTIFTA